MAEPLTNEYLALRSALSCIVSELSKANVLDSDKVIRQIQETVVAHRAAGRAELADLLHGISVHFLSSVRDPEPPSRS